MAKRRPSPGVDEGLPRPTPRLDGVLALDDTIAALVELDANGLCLQWRNHLGGTPPAHLPRWLLMKILAYRIQAAALGGLDKETLRILRQPRGRDARILGRASFRGADCDNAGGGQAQSGGAARPRMERQARACDGPRQGLRLERRDLWQPVASRQGDDRHKLERPSLLRLANGQVRPIRDGPVEGQRFATPLRLALPQRRSTTVGAVFASTT